MQEEKERKFILVYSESVTGDGFLNEDHFYAS